MWIIAKYSRTLLLRTCKLQGLGNLQWWGFGFSFVCDLFVCGFLNNNFCDHAEKLFLCCYDVYIRCIFSVWPHSVFYLKKLDNYPTLRQICTNSFNDLHE